MEFWAHFVGISGKACWNLEFGERWSYYDRSLIRTAKSKLVEVRKIWSILRIVKANSLTTGLWCDRVHHLHIFFNRIPIPIPSLLFHWDMFIQKRSPKKSQPWKHKPRHPCELRISWPMSFKRFGVQDHLFGMSKRMSLNPASLDGFLASEFRDSGSSGAQGVSMLKRIPPCIGKPRVVTF